MEAFVGRLVEQEPDEWAGTDEYHSEGWSLPFPVINFTEAALKRVMNSASPSLFSPRLHHLAAVSATPDGSRVAIWVDSDPEDPIVVTVTPITQDLRSANRRALGIIQGLCVLFEFAADQGWTQDSWEIHLDDLHTYNIVTRYLVKWKQYGWRTTKNVPVPGACLLAHLDLLISAMRTVKFYNYSKHWIDGDEPLRIAQSALSLVVGVDGKKYTQQ